MNARPEPAACALTTSPPPEGCRCRIPDHGDIATIVELVRAEEIALSDEYDFDADELLADWYLPRFDLERDAWLVEAAGGVGAGYGTVWDEKPHVEVFGEFSVRTEEPYAEAVSAHLLAHVETRSRELSAAAGGAPLLLGIPVDEDDVGKLDLLTRYGFAETRRFHRMRIDLRDGCARPAWPDGVEVRDFRRKRDEAAVHRTLEEAFAEHFRYAPLTLQEWERHSLTRTHLDTRLWLVAWDGPEVAGVCLAFDGADRGWVDDLAVRRPWRRRGLGRALLLESFARLKGLGRTEVVLGVDSENATGALELYRRAGMRVSRTKLFLEKEVSSPPWAHTDR
jgi:mycothiol synthase